MVIISLLFLFVISSGYATDFPGVYLRGDKIYVLTDSKDYWEKARISKVKRWLKKIEDEEQKDNLRKTALRYAARYSNIKLCKGLINDGVDINHYSIDGETVAMNIIGMWFLSDEKKTTPKPIDIELFQYLIDSGMDIDMIHSYRRAGFHGVTMLTYASQYCGKANKYKDIGYDKIVEILISRGADIEGNDGVATPLQYAVRSLDSKTILMLLDNGADIEANLGGKTPMEIATSYGLTKIMKLLLDNGANVEGDGMEGPYYLAAGKNKPEILNFLLKNGADPEANMSAIINSVKSNSSASQVDRANTLRILLDNGADPNIKGKDNCTPLIWAVEKGLDKSVSVLLEQDEIEVNAQDIDGRTAIYIASQVLRGKESINIFKQLVDAGADPYIQTKNGNFAANLRGTHPVIRAKKKIIEKYAASGKLKVIDEDYKRYFKKYNGFEINTSGKDKGGPIPEKYIGRPGQSAGNIEVWIKSVSNIGSSKVIELLVKAWQPGGNSSFKQVSETIRLVENDTIRIIAEGGDGADGDKGIKGQIGSSLNPNGGHGGNGQDGGRGGNGGNIILHVPESFDKNQTWLIIRNSRGKGGYGGKGGAGGFGADPTTFTYTYNKGWDGNREIIQTITETTQGGSRGLSGKDGRDAEDGRDGLVIYKYDQ